MLVFLLKKSQVVFFSSNFSNFCVFQNCKLRFSGFFVRFSFVHFRYLLCKILSPVGYHWVGISNSIRFPYDCCHFCLKMIILDESCIWCIRKTSPHHKGNTEKHHHCTRCINKIQAIQKNITDVYQWFERLSESRKVGMFVMSHKKNLWSLGIMGSGRWYFAENSFLASTFRDFTFFFLTEKFFRIILCQIQTW